MASTGFECAHCGEDRLLIECLGQNAERYYPTFCPTCGERLKTRKQVEKEFDEKYIVTPNGSCINRDDTSTLCQTCRGHGCSDCDNTGVWYPKEGITLPQRRRSKRA